MTTFFSRLKHNRHENTPIVPFRGWTSRVSVESVFVCDEYLVQFCKHISLLLTTRKVL